MEHYIEKKKGFINTHSNMAESHKHNVDQKEFNIKEPILSYVLNPVTIKNWQN